MTSSLTLLVCILLTCSSIQAQWEWLPEKFNQTNTRTSLGECMERLLAAERELGNLKGEKLRLLASEDTLKTEHNALRSQRASLLSDVDQLRNKLASSQAETEQLNSRIEVLQKQISELDVSMSTLTSKNSILESKLATLNTFPESKISPVLQVNSQVNYLINERNVVMEKLRTAEADKEKLTAEVERLTINKEAACRGTYDLEAKVAGLTSELALCYKQQTSFPAKMASLTSQNDVLVQQMATVQQEKEELTQTLQKLQAENSRLDDEVTKMKYEKSNIETEKLTLQSYINKLQHPSSGAEELVQRLQKEMVSLRSNKDNMAALKEDVMKLKNENSELKKVRTERDSTCAEQRQEVARLKSENAELWKQRAASEAELQETLKELTRLRLKGTHQSHSVAQNEVSELLSCKALLTSVEQRNSYLKDKNSALESTIAKLQTVSTESTPITKNFALESEYQIEVLTLRADNDKLTSALSVANVEIENLKRDVISANTVNLQLHSRIEELEARDADLKARLDSQDEVIKQIESEFNATQADIDVIRAEKNSLQREYAALMAERFSKSADVQRLAAEPHKEDSEKTTPENVEHSKDEGSNSTKQLSENNSETSSSEKSAVMMDGQHALQVEAARLASRISELASKSAERSRSA